MNKVVEQVLRTMAVDADAKWTQKVSFVEFAINSSVNASTGKAPFELLYGQPVRQVADHLDGLHPNEAAQQLTTSWTKLVEDAKQKLEQAQEQQAHYYNKKHRPLDFEVGDKVLLSTKHLHLVGARKMQQRYIGPLSITKKVGTQAYQLKLPPSLQKHHNVFHVSLLRPYVEGGDGHTPPEAIEVDGTEEWELERIVKHRRRGRRL